MSLCLACGATNPLDIKFCTQCGVKLQIQDRYRALRIIGQGGFGKTYLAQDDGKPSKPKCVIKQFSYDDPQSLRKALELFEQEAVRLDDLGHHDQVPELLAHCEQDGRQYLVQEFIDGENLLQELNRQGKFNEAKIKGLLLDLLPVLQFIHAGNVIHRDIKPANIIRRRSDGKLVLVDFGAAKMASKTALAKTGTTIGSAEYTSPEQARGKAVFASDIYALGVTCLYLLTQVSPFDMFSDHEGRWVWRDFLSGNGVSDGLGKVIDRMVDQTLARRYQTASDVLAVLQPRTSSPTSVQPATLEKAAVNPKSPSGMRRRDVLLLLGGSSALAVIAWENLKPKTTITTTTSPTPKPTSSLQTQTLNNIITVDASGQEISRTSSTIQYFTQNLSLPNGAVPLEMALIPKGKFMMGRPNNENGDNNEVPQHEVNFPQEFYMSRYAVTQAQWLAVMGKFTDKFNKSADTKFKGDNRPMIYVFWHEAREFCERLTATLPANRGIYRLPTEAEWEYACRAGTTTPFHFGETITPSLVNYNGNFRSANAPKGEYRRQTVDVNSFTPNAWGLHQMHGNVWEWCLDEYVESYSNKSSNLKNNGSEPYGDINEIRSPAVRGGAWNELAISCRSANRLNDVYSESVVGFRVVVA